MPKEHIKSSANMCYQQGPSAPWELAKPSSGPCSNVESGLKTWPKPLLRHLQPETAPLWRAPQLLLMLCMIKALRRCEGPIAAYLVLPIRASLAHLDPAFLSFLHSLIGQVSFPGPSGAGCVKDLSSDPQHRQKTSTDRGHSGAFPVGKG